MGVIARKELNHFKKTFLDHHLLTKLLNPFAICRAHRAWP
jgi:hypothetical protein